MIDSTTHLLATLRRISQAALAVAGLAVLGGCATPLTDHSTLASGATGAILPAGATTRTAGGAQGRPVRLAAASPNLGATPGEGIPVSDGPSLITRSLNLDTLEPPQEADEGKDAAGTPTDPLRPESAVNLGDAEANQDLWGRLRRGFTLPPLESELVGDHERWYAARPDYVQRMTDRASRYLFHVVDEVERRNMPAEMALLPFIESAFNPKALSSASASGIWQFMPATGKDYELRQNLFRDDRRDVLASTRAALDYLQRLHRLFGDWHLALAAYNWGEGNVQRAINRNLKAGLPADYLSLNMPAETRNYVPKLHAVRNIVARPQDFGLSLAPIENHPFFVSVPIQRDMDVDLAARLAQLPQGDFQALNPSMNKPVILAAGTPQILLPYDNASVFMANLQRHKGPLASWTAWVAPRTMRPSEVAKQVGMSEGELRDINRIPLRMLVKAGSTLLVPRTRHAEQFDVSESVADNAMMALAPDLPPMKRMVVKARKRDTVASVARRYKVSAIQVAQWNKMRVGDSFKRAQKVVVYVPVKGKQARAVAARGDDERDDDAASPKRKMKSAAKVSGVKKAKAKTKTAHKSGPRREAAQRAKSSRKEARASSGKAASRTSTRVSANREARVSVR